MSGDSIVIVTIHQSQTASPTAGVGGAQSNNSGSKGFFQNKGAVAGVFTVVGLVGLALLIALITNAIRRRQAEKFDRDVAEAAAEAAANARSPNFDDDDYGYRDPHQTGYSDGSHGTYGQPPMQAVEPQQHYGMSEVNQYDPYANTGPVTMSGAAGIGAAGVNRSKSMTAPYNAFAGPPVNSAPYASASQGMHDLPSQTSDQSLRYRQRGTSAGNQLDLFQAAGLGGAPGTAAAAAARGTPLSQRDSPSPAQLSRNKSLGTGTLNSNSSHGGNESYAAHYRPDFNPDTYQPPPQVSQRQPATYASAPPAPESRPVSSVDPYDGIAYDAPDTPLANPYSPNDPPAKSDPQPISGNFSSPETSSAEGGIGGDNDPNYPPFHEDDSRMSLRDDEDYGFGGNRRVLKASPHSSLLKPSLTLRFRSRISSGVHSKSNRAHVTNVTSSFPGGLGRCLSFCPSLYTNVCLVGDQFIIFYCAS
ncbi:hypothetical protein NLI96_g12565 [Meripilus lineatus]|uniref:Uncharacterized protein n=1 Tax=Meripilus lineatus TaxID=2056292 RepID=A0AAD5UR02_9APHY|nr:hypothetical protein NLI96_g12565 [Physisporinus lineatus]